MSGARDLGDSTRSIHAGGADDPDGDVVGAVHRSVIGRFGSAERFGRVMAGEEPGMLYGRLWNRSTDAAARAIAALEGVPAGLVTASGMAAIHAALVALVPGGGRAVFVQPLYGNTLSLARDLLAAKLGVDVRVADRDPAALAAACADGADLVYAETIANPGVAVVDLPALAEIAHAAGALAVVDNTLATPLLCRPAEHGVDVIVHSATKFLNGHHDVTAGAVCGREEPLARIARLLVDTGGICDPDAAFLLRRGMRTLALRLDRQTASTIELAQRLAAHPAVEAVPFPGLPGHPDRPVVDRLLGGRAGAVLPFVVRGGRAGGEAAMDRVRLIERVTSLGGISTGISHAASTSHRQLTAAELDRAGIPAGLLRLAVGCEDVDDLWDDLAGALDGSA